ncbi:DapH/DapD/GlmU-related protein [Niallia sp. FSL K6-0212]|uniref:DapH/DapD/GlmU-related protein n=1 Tax=Niallia sp. FSL K6-0212 TaxID=2921423 RepID=UPI0030F4B9AB
MFDYRDYFQISDFSHKILFYDVKNVWEPLLRIEDTMSKTKSIIKGIVEPGAYISEYGVILEEDTFVENGAYVKGPAYIGRGSKIFHGAYIRENTIIGDNCIVGHCSEVKHSILLNGSRAPHFNFVGNSILGNNVNLGGGVMIANVKNIPYGDNIIINTGTIKIDTGLKYFGAIIGDQSKIGANTVINPGTLIKKNVLTYPLSSVKGVIEDNSIVR